MLLIYGADELPLMEDQLRFSIKMMKTVWTSCIEASARKATKAKGTSASSVSQYFRDKSKYYSSVPSLRCLCILHSARQWKGKSLACKSQENCALRHRSPSLLLP